MMHRASVDLPHPVSPTSPSVSPRRTSRLDAVDRPDAAHLVLEEDAFLDREVLDDPSARSKTSPSTAGAGTGLSINRGPVLGGNDARQLRRPRAAVTAGIALPSASMATPTPVISGGSQHARRVILAAWE